MYEEHYADIRSYCLRRLSVEAANDAAAEIFIVAWRKIDEVPQGAEARLWLFAVARNTVAHQYRSRSQTSRLRSKLEQTAVRSPAGASAEDVVVRRSQDRAVLEALGRMKPDDQELVRLKMWEELSHAEIGEVFGISAHAVDMRMQRVGKRLARLLSATKGVRPQAIPEGGEL
ncbi:MAG: sigma-70 family RNA polymerase sigma factor [Acidimicrobiia bacterium]|nr:sigma-70 family RNA polymerase sigma factor [Acidimicrobiia bacterium]MBT8193966.1 sigma-70 family RNA polymerase sigma factor [Acidimicrobiia bacterium]NNF89055.1 sigma-70 family RNA polymerase sigma factor [Acidimicrobiia bacterium]NNL12357.1 sigma-70 family RNA polymerase sigma factor [Acidimicrobiia bacterium]NNL98517.1 sigma-70 family RNA polymerase sigma factor [Acidimicrobiia bacterium]